MVNERPPVMQCKPQPSTLAALRFRDVTLHEITNILREKVPWKEMRRGCDVLLLQVQGSIKALDMVRSVLHFTNIVTWPRVYIVGGINTQYIGLTQGFTKPIRNGVPVMYTVNVGDLASHEEDAANPGFTLHVRVHPTANISNEVVSRVCARRVENHELPAPAPCPWGSAYVLQGCQSDR